MFVGRYHHNIDGMGRLTIPARFRDSLGEDAAYIIQGLDQNLIVVPSSVYQTWTEQASETDLMDPNARFLRRWIFSSAHSCEIDKVGRIKLPDFLLDPVKLRKNEPAVITGCGDHFEIWSPENWVAQEEALQDMMTNNQRLANFRIFSSRRKPYED